MNTITPVTPQSVLSSTNQLASGRFGIDPSARLTPGPYWNSFEELRQTRSSGLEQMAIHSVGTLNCKAGSFRILRDADFQWLLGLAGDVWRLQKGLKVVIQAARVAVKHPDQEHLNLLLTSASLIAECPELPQTEGHESFALTNEERTDAEADDFDLASSSISRPKL